MPSTPVGKRLALKLGAQVTFSLEERPTFWMDTMIYLLFLSITPQDKWRLHEPPKEEPGGLEEHERELIQLFPEVWVKDKAPFPPGWLDIEPQ